MKFKKIISALLACAVVGGAMPLTGTFFFDHAIAAGASEEAGTYGVLTYRNYGDHITVTDCDESAEAVDIPGKIDGVPVTEIGEEAFMSCKSLTKVTIPDSVTTIDIFAFFSCPLLKDIVIPDSVTSVSRDAFGSTWEDNQPDGVIYVGRVLYSYKGEMPENTSISIKSGTVSISDWALNGFENLVSVTFPDELISIGEYAFRNTGITSVTIPDGVISIGQSAFVGCSELAEVSVPDSVVKIGNDAFGSTKWYDDQPDGLIYAGKVAYSYKGSFPDPVNSEIVLKEDTKAIADYAFANKGGPSGIKLPAGLTNIGSGAFSRCGFLKSIDIPKSCVKMGGSAFYGCTGLLDIIIRNAECDIYDSGSVICSNGSVGEDYYFNGRVYGYLGSTAQAYAKKYGYTFYGFGDVNNDENIDARDASMVLSEYALTATGGESSLSAAQEISANVNFDNTVDARDASVILSYYAYTATGGTDSFETFLEK